MKIAILLVLVLSCSVISIDIDSVQYRNLSGEEKKTELWKELIKNRSSYGWWNSFNMLRMFLSDMKPSFLHAGDEIPESRNKYIHAVGAVGMMELVSTNDHQYTGIFKGCKNVIGRLSLAKKPDTSKKSPEGAFDNFAPGMAIKCLRSKQPSANIIAMFGVEGQSSWNFFKNDFTNHIPEKIASFALKKLAQKFSTATPYVATLGTTKAASIDENGNVEEKPVLPFSLVFKPSNELRTRFSDSYSVDFLEQLGSIAPGTVIYELWANEHPDKKEVKIAELRLVRERFTPSNYGDKSLFFQHEDWLADLNIHPEWKPYRKTYEEVFGLMNPHAEVKETEEVKPILPTDIENQDN